jgi:AraC-like DNA-binding protein
MIEKHNNKIFKIKELPYLELKYSNTFYECSQKHYHNMLCILALKNGNAKVIIEDKEILLEKDKLVIINPNEVHYSVLDKYSEDYYVIYIDRTWYRSLQSLIFNTKDVIALSNEIFDLQIIEEFFNLFEYLYLDNEIIEKESKLLEFLNRIFEKCIDESIVLKIDNTTQIAKKFKSYIEDNIASKLTLTQISNALGFSPYHIIRICNQDFGLSANAYIVNKRVHRAKKMLGEGMDISQVAIEVGFYDQSHLTNIFKKVFAITPKAYQNSVLKEKYNE